MIKTFGVGSRGVWCRHSSSGERKTSAGKRPNLWGTIRSLPFLPGVASLQGKCVLIHQSIITCFSFSIPYSPPPPPSPTTITHTRTGNPQYMLCGQKSSSPRGSLFFLLSFLLLFSRSPGNITRRIGRLGKKIVLLGKNWERGRKKGRGEQQELKVALWMLCLQDFISSRHKAKIIFQSSIKKNRNNNKNNTRHVSTASAHLDKKVCLSSREEGRGDFDPFPFSPVQFLLVGPRWIKAERERE